MRVRHPNAPNHSTWLRTLGCLLAAGMPWCGEVTAQSASPRWTFQELLQPPSAGELREVDATWERKSWTVSDPVLVATTTVPVGSAQFVARLYTYTLNGSDRCGAVLVPPGAEPRTRTALIDIGDIRWDYPDRDLTRGLYLARILGDRASDFVVLVPCMRGTGLRIGESRVDAGGDRRDAWEGAAEDAMSFLSVAMAATVEIDTARVGVYGYSRGGGVALIVGQRDTRVKAVLDFAGPTDWFTAMGRPGLDWPSRLAEAWQQGNLQPDSRESQFFDFFLRDRETLPLSALRQRLLAASPLYFADRLPAVQVHHGEADRPVPLRNVTLLRDRLSSGSTFREVRVYPDAGHQLEDTPAFGIARMFLVEQLLKAPGGARRPAPPTDLSGHSGPASRLGRGR